jgi:hypothetical protein
MAGLWINGASTCTEVIAYDNFACSFGSYTCPSVEWTAGEDGTAEIVIMGLESSSASAAYALSVGKR